LDGGNELGSVGRVADLNHPVHDDAIGVVEDLGFAAELDRSAKTSLADGTSVGVT
jgi:hypothetical protein